MFTYSVKRAREIRKFHVAVVQRWLKKGQKSVMHVQSCCFTNKLIAFCRSRCRRRCCCYHGNVTSHFSFPLTSQRRFRITFTANDKRRFVPRDKVSPGSKVVIYCPLCVDKNESAECQVELFRTVLCANFLI